MRNFNATFSVLEGCNIARYSNLIARISGRAKAQSEKSWEFNVSFSSKVALYFFIFHVDICWSPKSLWPERPWFLVLHPRIIRLQLKQQKSLIWVILWICWLPCVQTEIWVAHVTIKMYSTHRCRTPNAKCNICANFSMRIRKIENKGVRYKKDFG